MAYLESGWFEDGGSERLSELVLDGAVDIAGSLYRGGVTPDEVQGLAVHARSLITLLDPGMRGLEMTERTRQIALDRLTMTGEMSEALYAFLADALEHVQSRRDLLGFYLHMTHIAKLLVLYEVTTESPASTPKSTP